MNKLVKSFGYAASGVWKLIKSERNARIHLLATVVVIIAGCIADINRYEWISICVAIGLVWSAEAFNTAVEKLTDLESPEQRPQAGFIKDVAAAGVLISACVAVAIALFVFIPYVV